MVSVLIPIGVFPFFVYANIANVIETCGNKDIDFVFLTHKTIPDNLQKALDAVPFQFRVLQAPFDSGYDQLKLLDWAFYYADLPEWVVVQHSDLFWHNFHDQKPWLTLLLETITNFPETMAVVYDDVDFIFKRYDKGVSITSDSMIMLNKHKFVRAGLKFDWGNYQDNEVFLSDAVVNEIKSGIVQWYGVSTRGNNINCDINLSDFWLDGGEAIALEMAVRFPNQIQTLGCLKFQFEHLWSFYRFASNLRREGEILYLDAKFDDWVGIASIYAYMICLLFDKNDIIDKPFTVSLLTKIINIYKYDLRAYVMKGKELAFHLDRYRTTNNLIGVNDLCGIKRMICEDHTFDLVKV
jgi:hypothetical protein